MSKTASSLFASQQFKSGNFNDWVIKMSIGATDWHFSRRPLRFGTVQTIDILDKHSGIKNKIDPLANSWGVGGTSVTLKNTFYKKDDSGTLTRISDEFGSIEGTTVEIYAVAGSTASALNEATDSVLKFVGVVSDPIIYDSKSVTIRVVSVSENFDKGLPEVYAPTVFVTYTANQSKFKRGSTSRRVNQATGTDMVPINYGTWAPSDAGRTGTGLAVGIPVSGSAVVPEICPAAHAMKSVDNIWFTQENADATYTDGVQRFLSSTFETRDGKTIATPSSTAYMRVYPEKRIPNSTDIQADQGTLGQDDWIPGGITYNLGRVTNDLIWGTVVGWTPDEVNAINDKNNDTFAELADSLDYRIDDGGLDTP